MKEEEKNRRVLDDHPTVNSWGVWGQSKGLLGEGWYTILKPRKVKFHNPPLFYEVRCTFTKQERRNPGLCIVGSGTMVIHSIGTPSHSQ